MCLAIRILILPNSWKRWRGIFKELSQDGVQADYSKNLHASLFHKYVSKNLISADPISMDSTFKVNIIFLDLP